MTDTDRTEILALLAGYEQALNTSDTQAAVATYAEDGEFYPYHLPTARGTEELTATYRQIFEAIRLDIAFDVRDVVVAGDLAYVTTVSEGKVTVLGPGITTPEANREVFVLSKSSGAWKVARYMFNKSEAPAAPGA